MIIFLSALTCLAATAVFAAAQQTEASNTTDEEIALLGKELIDADPKARPSIIARIGETGGSHAIDILLKILEHYSGEYQVRQAVIEALGDIQDSRSVDAAIAALTDYAVYVRQTAAVSLGKLGDRRAIVPLLIAFDYDEESTVREAAVESLVKLGEPAARTFYESIYLSIDAADRLPADGSARIYDYIIEAFQHWDPLTRENVVWALGRVKHAKIKDFIILCLKDESSYVRAAAAWSLEKSLDAHATASLIAVLKDPSPVVRTAAAYTLGNARSPDPVPSLIETLKDDQSDVREAAAYSLFKIKDRRSLEPLCEAITDPDYRVRTAAAYGLGAIGLSTISFDALIGALRDENEEVREAAAFSFARLKDRHAASAILKALEDPSGKVRKAAAYALGEIGELGVADRLLGLMGDRNPAVREALAEALDRLNQPIGKPLNNFIKGDRQAGATLVRRGDPRVAQLFLDELKAPTSSIRQPAVWYLAEIGEPRAQEEFVRMAGGWNISERFKAGMALSRLKVRPIPKAIFVSLDVITSPASITYFFLIVCLSGIFFYAACPYSPVKKLLYGITAGTMLAGIIFLFPFIYFSWLFFVFLPISIFPFIIAGSLTALISLHPDLRPLLDSDENASLRND